jgi:AbrB family looped-hinge helix DNA binding protein
MANKNGKLGFMNATVEIDKAGRIVVPKKVREAMHLRPGDKLDMNVIGDKMTVEHRRAGRGLYEEGGWLVYDSGGAPFTAEQVDRWVADDREERMRHILGTGFGL